MFNSYNNERNQTGGMAEVRIDLDGASTNRVAPPAETVVAEPKYEVMPEYVMKDKKFYKLDNNGFVGNQAETINEHEAVKKSDNDGTVKITNISIQELLTNCINGTETDQCKVSMANTEAILTKFQNAINNKDDNLVLYCKDLLINKYLFETIPDPNRIQMNGKPKIVKLETVSSWLSKIKPEVTQAKIRENKNLTDLLQIVVAAINTNDKFLNPHLVPLDPAPHFRTAPYPGMFSNIWKPTHPIDNKARCTITLNKYSNLITTNLLTFRSAMGGLIFPLQMGGGYDQVGGAIVVDKNKVLNQLRDASPYFKQLFTEFEQVLSLQGKNIDDGDKAEYSKNVDEYKKIISKIKANVELIILSMNQDIGNAKDLSFQRMRDMRDANAAKLDKYLTKCEDYTKCTFGALGTMVSFM
jgi:hypothetical protein